MYDMEFEQLATEIVRTHSFAHTSFVSAIARMDFTLMGKKHYLEYDRLTMYQYNCDMLSTEQGILYSLVKDKLAELLSNEEKKCLYEYWALLWFIKCCRLDYSTIRKTNRPDFQIVDSSGKRIGIEVTELTSSIDQRIRSTMEKFRGLSYDKARGGIIDYLGDDADKVDIIRFGISFLLIPKEVTRLTDQRQCNAQRLQGKYDKYDRVSGMINQFDEFIILGDALRSEVAITNENEVDKILDMLKSRQFRINTSFVIVFKDYKSQSIHSKGISSTFQIKAVQDER